MDDTLDGTFVAPSCIPLLRLVAADAVVSERVGTPLGEENVGVRGGGTAAARRLPLRAPFTPIGTGADVGRSIAAPAAEAMVVWRSPAASCAKGRSTMSQSSGG